MRKLLIRLRLSGEKKWFSNLIESMYRLKFIVFKYGLSFFSNFFSQKDDVSFQWAVHVQSSVEQQREDGGATEPAEDTEGTQEQLLSLPQELIHTHHQQSLPVSSTKYNRLIDCFASSSN